MNYDIVIMIVEKNMEILKTTISYLKKHITHRDIVLIGKKKLEEECQRDFPYCKYIDEDNLYMGMTYDSVNMLITQKDQYAARRTGWYFQQFLKMAYACVCEDSHYLVWDADTIPLRPISMINRESGKPYFDVKTEYNKPYFTTLKKLFYPSVKKDVAYSYISEHMLIAVDIMKNLIKDIEKNNELTGECFYEKIMDAVLEIDLLHSGFSEFETYGNYVNKNYKDYYIIRKLKSLRDGKYYLGNELNKELLEWASCSYDLISIEENSKTNSKILFRIPKLMAEMTLEDVVEMRI